ncbi:hypothetical protein D4R75_02620 [bacterium]|nr:MAG: hypothetical protein D4R75_02620 [bacterium]
MVDAIPANPRVAGRKDAAVGTFQTFKAAIGSSVEKRLLAPFPEIIRFPGRSSEIFCSPGDHAQPTGTEHNSA